MNKNKLYMLGSLGMFVLVILVLSYMHELNTYTAFGILIPTYFFGFYIGKQQKKS